MGCSASTDNIPPYAVRLYGNKFAIEYVKCVLEKETAKMPIISKLFHLHIFLMKNGRELMHNEDIHKYVCDSKYNYGRVCGFCSQYELTYELQTYFCCFAMNDSINGTYYSLNNTTVDFDVDCYVLNRYVKKQALAEIAIQQQKLIDYTQKNIEYCKQEITRLTQLTENNNDIMENEENHNKIAQIHDENKILHKQLNGFKKIVSESELKCNKLDNVNANIAKLQRLCKILVCEKLTDSNVEIQHETIVEEPQQIARNVIIPSTDTVKQEIIAVSEATQLGRELILPSIPTATPIVYPSVPNHVPICVASYAEPSGTIA